MDDAGCHHSHDTPKRGNFIPAELKQGASVGVKVTPSGDIQVMVSGKEPVIWNLPGKSRSLTDRKVWGVVEVYGCTRKISTDYRLAGECKHQYMYMYVHFSVQSNTELTIK